MKILSKALIMADSSCLNLSNGTQTLRGITCTVENNIVSLIGAATASVTFKVTNGFTAGTNETNLESKFSVTDNAFIPSGSYLLTIDTLEKNSLDSQYPFIALREYGNDVFDSALYYWNDYKDTKIQKQFTISEGSNVYLYLRFVQGDEINCKIKITLEEKV